MPDQLHDVQAKLADLKASFDKKDYAAVVSGAPAVLTAAQGLATAAAAKKDEVLKALNTDWSGLSTALPGYVTAIQSRIDLLGKKSGKKLATGIDVPAAKAGLADATALWSKALRPPAAGLVRGRPQAACAGPPAYAASVPSLTMTALPPMRTAMSSWSSSTSSLTLTRPGRFICRPCRPMKEDEALPSWPNSHR